MVQNDPAKKKLWGSKVDEIGFLLVFSVHGDFEEFSLQEGVGIKTREGFQSNRNTKIGKVAYC